MIRWILPLLTVVTLLAAPKPSAHAQYYPNARNRPANPGYNPNSPPILSPYLNMLRGGDPATNYYLGVVPERYQRGQNAQMRGAIQQLDQRLNTDGIEPSLGTTGHVATFMNYAPYYNLNTGSRFVPSTMPTPPPAGKRPR